MAEIEKVIKDLELVKNVITWDNPLGAKDVLNEAIQTIRELQSKSQITNGGLFVPLAEVEALQREFHIERDRLLEQIKELQSKSEEVCEWKLFDEEANAYDTSCRNSFFLEVGSPKYNNMKYCPYCGRKIKVVE